MNDKKIPYDPSQHIGKWALSINCRIFKIEATQRNDYGDIMSSGRTLQGGRIASVAPILLSPQDQEFMEENHG